MNHDILDAEGSNFSDKKYVVAVSLSAIFGIFGIQHFYLERWGLGALDLGMSIAGITLISMGIWWGGLILLVDFIHTIIVTYKLLVGEFRDGDDKIVPYPGQKEKQLR
jgi:TM2 domain-containing membrane protein YozV